MIKYYLKKERFSWIKLILQIVRNDFINTVFSIYPVYKYDSKKLTYNEFYLKNINDLNDALLRIYPKIDMKKINSIIDETPYISDTRKEFLKKPILFRKENIPDKAYKKLIKTSE